MSIVIRFFSHLVMWTAILAVFFTMVLLLTGSADLAGALTSFMVLGGLALVLAAFPAGIAVSRKVLTEGSRRVRPLTEFAAATLALAVLVLILVGWIGPSLAGALEESRRRRTRSQTQGS
jgi:hypothetical protein